MIDSNMPKRPTLLAGAALAVALGLGFALSSAPAFADPPPHSHGGGGGDEATYRVTISMMDPPIVGLEGMSGGADWIQSGKLIEPTDPGDVGDLTSLSFFTEADFPFPGMRGSSCFDDADGDPQTIPLFGGFLKQGRRGRAEDWFWFSASTFDTLPDGSEPTPRYLLRMVGEFDQLADWPPAIETPMTMTMTDWELKIEAPEDAVKSISCIGEGGQGAGEQFTVEIEVVRTN